jgi:threonine dehydratase
LERVVTVGEEELSLAILRLAELEKSVVEGAAAAPLAAALAGKLPELAGKRVVWVLTGGNIDPMILSRVIEHGLVADGRLSRFTAVVSDRPGGLSRLAQLMAAAGASVHEIAHERAFAGPDVATVNIQCTVETSDREHLARLHQLLREQGIAILPAASQPEDST